MKRVLVTGGTGFTGRFVARELVAAGAQVRCLVRNRAKAGSLPKECEVVDGSLEDPDSLLRAMQGCDALANVASLGFGHAPNIVVAAEKAGVARAVFVSTTSVFTKLNAPSKTVRLAAEKLIEGSRLDYVILRPTMIYGTSGDRNICRLVRYLHRWPVIPVLGSGAYLMQPIFVADLASVIARAALAEGTFRKAYNVSGKSPLSYNAVIDTVCAGLGKRVRKLHLPASPAVSLLTLFEKARLPFPVKAEQVLRLNEDKAFGHEAAAADFGFKPREFADGVREEIAEMGLKK